MPETFLPGPTVGPFDHLTRSRLAARLMELHANGRGETCTVPRRTDDPYRDTKSLRKTLERHGYKLHIRKNPDAGLITVFASKPQRPTG